MAAEKPAWMVRLRDRNIVRRATAVDRWAAANLQAFEQLVVVDGAPAAVEAESGPDRRIGWLVIGFIAGSLFVPISLKLAYVLPGAVLLVAISFLSLKRRFVAVTNRRFLVQEVSPLKAEPMGRVSSYPLRAVTVLGYKRGKNRPPTSKLTISIAEPSGVLRKMALGSNEVVFPGRAEAVRRAVEDQASSALS